MKANNFKSILFLPLFILFIFTSCQNEESDIVDPNEEDTIEANSTLANYIQYTTTYDGSYDNIIDSANCLSVNLPVTITVNGITITIEAVEDYDVLEDLLDAYDNDADQIEIQFPITITLSNYEEIVINNYDELNEFIEECFGENEPDDDIECIDFQYPFSISVYNANFQVIDTVEINNDEELYNFIINLEAGVLASINFPINMVLANGEVIQVNNNNELQAAIEEAENACDEDDDNDWNDDDCSEELVVLALKECLWNIAAYNDTDYYSEYELNFKNNDSLQIFTPNNTIIEADWILTTTDNGLVLNLDDLADLQNDFGGDWLIEDCDEDRFEFVNEDIDSTMVIEQDCESNSSCNTEEVSMYLQECFWYAGSSLFNNVVSDLFYFGPNNELTVTDSQGGNEITGVWEIEQTAIGVMITLDIPQPYEMISIEWVVTECDEDRVKMWNGNNYLVFEKDEDCSDCNNSGFLTNDLVLYMPFGNELHELVEDVFGNAPITYVEDRDGNPSCAISFTGTNVDAITIPITDQNQLVQGDSFSVSLWFKMQNNDPGNLESFFRKGNDDNQGFSIGVYDLNKPLVYDYNQTFNMWEDNVDLTNNTEWHHLVVTVDANNTVRMYRNGTQVNVDENSNFNIGSDPLDSFLLGQGFVGHLDDLRVYKRTISAGEVEDLFNLDGDCYTCL